jgi:hypothetical protein
MRATAQPPLHTSTTMRAPAAGATRLHTGTTIHTIIGQYYKALGPMRGTPEFNGPRASLRYLANSLLPSQNQSTIFLFLQIQLTAVTV